MRTFLTCLFLVLTSTLGFYLVANEEDPILCAVDCLEDYQFRYDVCFFGCTFVADPTGCRDLCTRAYRENVEACAGDCGDFLDEPIVVSP